MRTQRCGLTSVPSTDGSAALQQIIWSYGATREVASSCGRDRDQEALAQIVIATIAAPHFPSTRDSLERPQV